MEEIDARGLACPKPVVLTKKALENNNEVLTIVDNKAASENVGKLAKKLNCSVSNLKENDDKYKIKIKKMKNEESDLSKKTAGKVYLIDSEFLGSGDEELGKILIKGFLSTLIELDPLPDKLIFLNSGVKLTSVYDDSVEVIKELEEKGVDVLSCGTCLDYYDIMDELKVGSVSNMYEIADSINSDKFVTI